MGRYVWLRTVACLLPAAAQELVVEGPFEELSLLDDFATDPSPWTPRGGANVRWELTPAYELPGVARSLLRLHVTRADPADREAGHNWFQVVRQNLPPELVPANADGLRLVMGSHAERQWWISIELTTADGQRWSRVYDQNYPAGRMVDHVVPFAEFRNQAQEPLTAAAAGSLQSLAVTCSTPGVVFYLDRLTTWRRERLTSWIELADPASPAALYEPGQPVPLTLTVGGTPPAAMRGVRLRVADRLDQTVLQPEVVLGERRQATVDVTPPRHGWYQLTARWLDAAGQALPGPSVIRAEGTVPVGLATFSVLPHRIADNQERIRQWGQQAFFGIHGDFMGLGDRTGLTWRLGYTMWYALEPRRPDPAAGPPEWVAKELAEPPQPAWRFHILPQRTNLGGEAPAWARRPAGPPPSEWDAWEAMIRNAIRVEKHRYPHQQPRLYGGAWEINLNMPPFVSQPPEHTPADVVEIFRRLRALVDAADPGGQVIGPCPSVLDLAWYERVCEAGVLRYLDGIETHAYPQNAYSPEENDYPGKLAALRALLQRYAPGRELPIYITEVGQLGKLGSESLHLSHAERLARLAIILKGEGVRVLLPFYGLDYERTDGWGFLFNLDVDPPRGPWHSRRACPKPAVTALAACVDALEGSTPAGRDQTFGPGVWAYRFQRGNQRILAVWKPGAPRTVPVPVTGPTTIYDLEGHPTAVPAGTTRVDLPVGEAVQYLISGG
ncbi:MAG: hypothetical protein IT204_22440 [Fimbriimonadaceae bacterium]|nr:hypothetical protein [Fimbriimonadaceae bacterium]